MILVVGSSGNVGRHLVAELEQRGTPWVPLTGRLEDSDSLAAALTDVDVVFLVWPFLTTEHAPAVLDAIGDRRVVYVSSIGVGGPDESADHIFGMHADMERRIDASGVPRTFLRADTIASNTLGWAQQIRSTGVVRGPLTPATAVVDPRDIAAVAVSALLDETHAGQTYLLTGPRPISRPEQVAAIGTAIGRELRFDEVPVDEARAQMLADGRPPLLVDALLSAAENRAASTQVTSTVEDVTGAPPRDFARWALDHHDAFEGAT